MKGQYSHSGDIGDLLAALPVVRTLGGGDLTLYPSPPSGNRMTRERVENIRAFLELQPYLGRIDYSDSPIGLDLDEWRRHYNDQLNISDMVASALKVRFPDRERPWLRIDTPRRVAPVVFARSSRYRNPAVDWRRLRQNYGAMAVFVGTKDEHSEFERLCGQIEYVPTATYLDLARIVSGAELVCANQTSIRWLAEVFKLPVVVEAFPSENNTHWARRSTWYLFNGDEELPEPSSLEGHFVDMTVSRIAGSPADSSDLRILATIARGLRSFRSAFACVGTLLGPAAMVLATNCPEIPIYLNPPATLHCFACMQLQLAIEREVVEDLQLFNVFIGTNSETESSGAKGYSLLYVQSRWIDKIVECTEYENLLVPGGWLLIEIENPLSGSRIEEAVLKSDRGFSKVDSSRARLLVFRRCLTKPTTRVHSISYYLPATYAEIVVMPVSLQVLYG